VTLRWHLITGEFPPAPGGVSDYTRAVAEGLAAAGESVDVWCPAADGRLDDPAGVRVHRSAGAWTATDFRRLDRELEATPSPRRLLVQWVPHAFGRRSMNIGFCRWVRRRARRGDVVDLMVHEPGLAFREGALRHDVVAGVHRLMAAMLLGVARRAWVAIPAWAATLRPWAGATPFCWLPVPSTLAVTSDESLLERVRSAARGADGLLVGHFGTYDAPARRQLQALVPGLMRALGDARFLLLGRGSDAAAAELRRAFPELQDRFAGAGGLGSSELSAHLQACDVMVQPYIDGASTRRTTLMAALAHGVPVVTTIGRLSEPFWSGSSAVSAVPAGDIEGLIHAAVTLAGDRARRKQQAEAGRKAYASRFALTHVILALREDRCEPVAQDAARPAAE
jgi:glycosyltransferase involved in cell wall biosynthesis